MSLTKKSRLTLFLTLPLLFLSLAALHAQEAGAMSGLALLTTQVPSACNPVVSGDRPGEGETTHALTFDGDVKSYFDSTYSNWQYVQIDFNCVGTFSALRRYMTSDGSDATSNRGPQGERVSYSLDGAAWTDLTANTTYGWEDYFNYGNESQAWHSVSYGWSSWLTLNTPVQARYLRFHWDDNFDALNEIEVDFVEPTQDNDPPRFTNFAPSGWITDTQEVEVSIQALDTGSVISGLNPDSAQYSFTTDARATWSALLPATAGFTPGHPGPETMSATIDFGSDSEDLQREGDSLHWVRFQLDDIAGNRGYSEEYPVHIDTTPPQPRGLIYQSHTPEQWSGDPTVDVQWITAFDPSSGVAGYDAQWVQLTGEPKECPAPRSPAFATPAIASTSPVLADAVNWYVCIWALDNVGHWSSEPDVGGPYWIDAQPPEAVTNVHSTSHGAARWTNEPLIEMSWSVPVGGAAGYAYAWDHNPSTAPTTAMNTTSNTRISATLPAEHNTWYFHVAAYDRAGNYGPADHYGPLGLDRTPPDAPYILGPPSGWVTGTLTVRWTPQGVRQGSPVAVHSYEWGISSIQPPDDVVDTLDTQATEDFRTEHGETVYLTVKSRDQAGNWGPYSVAGPYEVDALAPNCRIEPVVDDALVHANPGGQYLSLETEFSLDLSLQNPPGGTGGAPEWVDAQYAVSPSGPWNTWLYQGSPGRRQFAGAQQNTTYFLRCRGTDEAGNEGSYSPSVRVTVHIPDLQIGRVEVTQGIQDVSNSVSLVEGKSTWVRVFVEDAGFPSHLMSAEIPNVVVLLYGLRADGTALPGSPLSSICTAGSVGCPQSHTIPSTPENGSSTVNLRLPSTWSEGEVSLQAYVNPPILPGNERPIAETNYANNDSPFQSYEFHPKAALRVTPIRINYLADPNNPLMPAPNAFQQNRSFTEKLWPAPMVQQGMSAGPDTLDFAGDLTTRLGWNQLINELAQMRANASVHSSEYWYGLVPSIPNPGALGMAPLGGTVAAGIADDPAIMPHELGHNFNRRHAQCNAPDGLDPNFPHPDASIGAYGFDPLTAQVYAPSVKDVMSYCPFPWISPYTFQGIFADMPASSGVNTGLAAEAPSQSYLMVSGLISEEGSVAFNPLYRLDLAPAGNDTHEDGPYRIELQNGAGQSLGSRSFDLFHDLSFFSQILPEPAELARVVLLRGEQVLGAIDASANAPQVSLLEPAAGAPLSDAVTARWQATDADGDALTYALQYSPDGGETWSPIAHGLRQTNYTFALEDLAGSEQGLLRIVASDGFHSAHAVSDGFLQIPDHAPQAFIVHPADHQMLALEQALILQGQGLDKEDGELAPEQLVWSSDRDGMLGAGREIIAQEMSPGWHTITLTVTDGDARQSDATIRLYVGAIWQNHLPLVAHD